MLLSSQLAKGLFQAAILESASTRMDMSLKDAECQNVVFVERSSCNGLTSFRFVLNNVRLMLGNFFVLYRVSLCSRLLVSFELL